MSNRATSSLRAATAGLVGLVIAGSPVSAGGLIPIPLDPNGPTLLQQNFLFPPIRLLFPVGLGFIYNNGLHDGIVFPELQSVKLAAALPLDTGGEVAAGTRVSSYYVAFDDPVERHQHNAITFSTPVLGIEYLDGGDLVSSDFLGLPNLTYFSTWADCAECGYEPDATVSFSGNTAYFESSFSEPGDQARVITLSIPEPAAWVLTLVGFAALGLAGQRRGALRG